MNERLLQYIWQHRHFNLSGLETTSGEPLQVLDVGKINPNQGPDFLEGKIKIGNATFVGNIELHVRSSDWNLHRHSADKHYGNIILHVVWQHDSEIKDIKGTQLLTLELQPYVASSLLSHYRLLMENNFSTIACAPFLPKISPIVWLNWKERLAVERLSHKTQRILTALNNTNGNWENVLWQALARNFGLPVNADAFEEMAASIPVQTLAKCKFQPALVEALLFGQAGLLGKGFAQEYPLQLQKDYRFLAQKYRLHPISKPILFARMRPSNFPTVRLAQLSALIVQSSHLFATILDAENIGQLRQIFAVRINDYWLRHYVLEDEPSEPVPKKIGSQMTENIVINTIIPLLFAYGSYKQLQDVKDKALEWLSQLKSENNHILKKWNEVSVQSENALESQSLIELYKNYCTQKRCLECAVGNVVLKEQA